MFVLQLFLKGVVFPALVCGFLLWVIPWVARKPRKDWAALSGVSLAAGYLAAHILSIGLPSLPPVGTTQWLFLLVAVAALVGVFTLRKGKRRLVLTGVLVAGLLAASLRPMLEYHWERWEAALWFGGLFSALLLLWSSLQSLADRGENRVLLPSTFLILCLGTAAVLGLSATALLAQLAAAASACIAVLLLVSLRAPLPPAWLPVALMILTGLVLNGYFYAQLTPWNAAALLSALAAPWVSRLPWIRQNPSWRRTFLALGAVLLIAAAAVGAAALDFLEAPDDDYY